MGHKQILASVMVNVAMVTGLKSRILGYMSIGDNVCGIKRERYINQREDLKIHCL